MPVLLLPAFTLLQVLLAGRFCVGSGEDPDAWRPAASRAGLVPIAGERGCDVVLSQGPGAGEWSLVREESTATRTRHLRIPPPTDEADREDAALLAASLLDELVLPAPFAPPPAPRRVARAKAPVVEAPLATVTPVPPPVAPPALTASLPPPQTLEPPVEPSPPAPSSSSGEGPDVEAWVGIETRVIAGGQPGNEFSPGIEGGLALRGGPRVGLGLAWSGGDGVREDPGFDAWEGRLSLGIPHLGGPLSPDAFVEGGLSWRERPSPGPQGASTLDLVPRLGVGLGLVTPLGAGATVGLGLRLGREFSTSPDLDERRLGPGMARQPALDVGLGLSLLAHPTGRACGFQ
jgi:hypothetical protein